MADVNPLESFQHDTSRTDRGQLLVLTGLVLALTLVILAVLLNSVIYAENLGTRGSDIGGNDPVEVERSLTVAAADFLRSVNRNAESQGDHENLSTEYEDELAEWHEQTNQHVIRDGDYSESSIATTAGTRINQSESDTFESADDANTGQWTLAEDVRVREYVIEVDANETAEDSEDPFRLVVSDEEGDEWTLEIYSDGETLVLVAANESEVVEEYDTNGENAVIDFSSATIDTESSDAVRFAQGLNPTYTIAYENPAKIDGTYRLTVDDPTVEDSSDFHDTTAESPHAISAVYSAEIDFRYEGRRIEYGSTIRIAPEEL